MTKYFEMAGTNAERVLSLLEQRGISRDRIEIRPGTSQQEHLATYGEIDIVLDCYPQHGGMSSLEAVWMGVPVVTLCHPTKPSGRVGRYILQNVGLTALVSDTPEQYVQIAAALAHGPDTLASLRQHLRQRMANSPICDTAAFRRRASAAFRHMWTRYCAGLPPETFTVADD